MRHGAALICWILFACILLVFSASSKLSILSKQFENFNFKVTLPTNQLDTFSYTRFDSKMNYRPTYAIAFENLLLENNGFGPFKTAMYKKAMIRDLELRFYRYTSAAKGESTIDVEELIRDMADRLTRPSNRYSIGNINFANVSEVYADNFDCRFFYKNDLSLSIHCKRATASYRNYNMELRGHVTIKTADGTTLESNFVEWDIRSNVFRVNSAYVLNRNGDVKTGRNACFNFELKEEHKCIAKL